MKKIMIGILMIALVLTLGSAVYAESNDEGQGTFNFGQMLPFMKQVHPDLTEQQLKDMHNNCHGTNGAAPSKNFEMPNNRMGY
ncbi:MAG: hypothetical protein WD424_06425 [Paenibacillaceae bacterium]